MSVRPPRDRGEPRVPGRGRPRREPPIELEILHDEERGRFRAEVEGGEARLDYRRGDGDVVDFRSTYVPDEARGGGVASRIVTRGFEWAKENGLRVIPTCSYVRAFVDRHPEYRSLVSE